MECVYRDSKRYSVFKFILNKWYEIPCLVIHIPYFYTDFPINIIFFQLFRSIRFVIHYVSSPVFLKTYFQLIINVMVKYPPLFVSSFFLLYICLCCVYIKIFEQNAQKSFSQYFSVIWFAFVTSTTTGYGDYYPTTLPARILAVTLMFIGIGLVSTVSAIIIGSIVGV